MAIIKQISTSLLTAPIDRGESKMASILAPTDIHVPPELQDYIDNLEPDPRFAYMHAIAMSDGDMYGSNLNGDIFEWPELCGQQTPEQAAKNRHQLKGVPVPRYRTFETARYYRRHAHSAHDPHFGDMPLAAINSPMHRIELIVRIAREPIPELGMHGAPDIANKLDQGRLLVGSMGCRIDHEQCTYCKAKNSFVRDRCDHLKHHMHEVLPNGLKIAAKNYGMNFFDYSDVIVPADPIAMDLGKVASVLDSLGRPANTASDLAREDEWRRKWAAIVKQIPTSAIGLGTSGSGARTPLTPFSVDELKRAMAHGFDAAVSTAAVMGIVFSPAELAKMAEMVTPADTDGIIGFTRLDVTEFDTEVYHALRSKIASRSGYVAAFPNVDWNPTKIASAGFQDVGDFYAYYRASLSALPLQAFTKFACSHPTLRAIHENRADRLTAAARYVAHAGLD